LAALNGPAIPSDTELFVLTQPAGASVTVNGVGWGAAPVTIRYLPPGEKLIRVSRDGDCAARRGVTAISWRPATLPTQLNSRPWHACRPCSRVGRVPARLAIRARPDLVLFSA